MYKISTRGQYALLIMEDLADAHKGEFMPLRLISHRRNLSVKYLEQILPALTKNGLIVGLQGKGGGYRLTRPTNEYKIGEILRLTEKDLASVSCLAPGAPECAKRAECKTVAFWEGLDKVMNDYMDSKTLEDLL